MAERFGAAPQSDGGPALKARPAGRVESIVTPRSLH